MISKGCLMHLRRLVQTGTRSFAALDKDFCRRQYGLRQMATVTDLFEHQTLLDHTSQQKANWISKAQPSLDTHVTTTVYKFPEMEPLRFAYYPRSQLYVPMRRDILHRAVVYEGDKTRQGSAFSKTRWDVHGSHRKLRKQKGTGKARVGDKQSPTRVGGGSSHGPKARDFSTGLQRKVYDLAFRIALSYRYKKGQLIVVDAIDDVESVESWYLEQIFRANGWGRASGRSTLITLSKRPTNEGLFDCMARMDQHGRIKDVTNVDLKNLLETKRLVIEKNALDKILALRSRDLKRRVPSASSELPPVNTGAIEA